MNRPENPHHPTSARDRRTAWLLVFGQFALLAPIVLLPGRASWILPTGLAVAGGAAEVVGILVMVVAATSSRSRSDRGAAAQRARAAPHPRALPATCATPSTADSCCSPSPEPSRTAVCLGRTACVLLIVLINVKARWEEAHLCERFPDYLSYARRTPRFIPRPNRH